MNLIILGLVNCLVLIQAQDPRQAAILTDARYLAGDGTFGAAYTQEDGVSFKEESDANGDRRGSYSYVDPTGHRRTVHYTAGKNGFQPIGEGIPKVTLPTPPPPQYEPLPQYNSPEYHQPPRSYQYRTEPQYAREPAYEPRPTSPPVYESRPTAPTPRPYQPRYQVDYQSDYQQYQPRPAHHQRQILAQYSPQEPEYRPEPHQYRPHLEYSYASPSRPAPRSSYNDITTASPRRFYPPGKLEFTRTPDGFAYSFSKS